MCRAEFGHKVLIIIKLMLIVLMIIKLVMLMIMMINIQMVLIIDSDKNVEDHANIAMC